MLESGSANREKGPAPSITDNDVVADSAEVSKLGEFKEKLVIADAPDVFDTSI